MNHTTNETTRGHRAHGSTKIESKQDKKVADTPNTQSTRKPSKYMTRTATAATPRPSEAAPAPKPTRRSTTPVRATGTLPTRSASAATSRTRRTTGLTTPSRPSRKYLAMTEVEFSKEVLVPALGPNGKVPVAKSKKKGTKRRTDKTAKGTVTPTTTGRRAASCPVGRSTHSQPRSICGTPTRATTRDLHTPRTPRSPRTPRTPRTARQEHLALSVPQAGTPIQRSRSTTTPRQGRNYRMMPLMGMTLEDIKREREERAAARNERRLAMEDAA